jgi:hypothetical protein
LCEGEVADVGVKHGKCDEAGGLDNRGGHDGACHDGCDPVCESRVRRINWAMPGNGARKMVSARKGLVQVSRSGGESICLTICGRYGEHREE